LSQLITKETSGTSNAEKGDHRSTIYSESSFYQIGIVYQQDILKREAAMEKEDKSREE
jgi:hypothetical protein